MQPVHALALRRAALVGAGFGLTVAAHAAAVDGLRMTPYAPVAWLTLMLGALMCGGRRRFVPRSFGRTFTVLAVVQLVAHLLLMWAPWVVGLVAHHEGALVEPRALLVHALGALLLALVLHGADRLLAAAVAVARLLRAAVRRRVAPPSGAWLAPVAERANPQQILRVLGARGPPPRPTVAAT